MIHLYFGISMDYYDVCKKPYKMKTSSTPNPSPTNCSISKIGLIIASLLLPVFVSAQNLVTNSSFSNGSTSWTNSCSVEIYSENVYGGSDASNPVTEIDEETCIDQDVCIMAGVTYSLSFKGSRRTAGGAPSTVGISIKVKGVHTGTTYVNQNKSYNNTSFNLSTQTYTFTIAANSSERKINIHIEDNNNHNTLGAILDDISSSRHLL
jgi:hypothetical protein